MREEELLRQIQELRQENSNLLKENRRLLRHLQLLEDDKTISECLRAESLVARLVQGVLSTHNASYDVKVPHMGVRLEVKFSKLNVADRHSGTPTKRWAWSKPFGESGNKIFDRLILLGVKDEHYVDIYEDRNCPFIVFDVPYKEIEPLTIRTNNGRYRSVQLTTNPKTAHSAASPLFQKYQITEAELEHRYGRQIGPVELDG